MEEKHDTELDAMRSIHETLGGLLDDETRARVLQWAAKRHGIAVHSGSAVEAPGQSSTAPQTNRNFSDFPSLFDAARPRSGEDRALVAGYWFQIAQGQGDLDSQSLNTTLKNMGHGDSNITASLTRLQRRRPTLVLQVRKSGRSRQARKKYRLTDAGVRAVERMIRGESDDTAEEAAD